MKGLQFLTERAKNPQFYLRIILISFLPILAAMGTQIEGIVTWEIVGQIIVDFLKNPYLIGLYIATLIQSFQLTKNKE